MIPDLIRYALVLVIAFVYSLFDLYNKRNVWNSFAYLSVLVGFVVTLTLNQQTMLYSILLAIAIAAISYLLFKIGWLGSGDGFEFVALSLLVPIQPQPIFQFVLSQLNLPFMLSAFIATGVVAIIVAPLYYLLLVRRSAAVNIFERGRDNSVARAAILVISYLVLFLLVVYVSGFRLISLLLVTTIVIPSAITALFETEIMLRMIESVYPKELEVGDIIAVNLMKQKDIAYYQKKSKDFGRLVTEKLLRDIEKLNVKLPVYKKALPLAPLTFIGVLISFAFGNILLILI